MPARFGEKSGSPAFVFQYIGTTRGHISGEKFIKSHKVAVTGVHDGDLVTW